MSYYFHWRFKYPASPEEIASVFPALDRICDLSENLSGRPREWIPESVKDLRACLDLSVTTHGCDLGPWVDRARAQEGKRPSYNPKTDGEINEIARGLRNHDREIYAMYVAGFKKASERTLASTPHWGAENKADADILNEILAHVWVMAKTLRCGKYLPDDQIDTEEDAVEVP